MFSLKLFFKSLANAARGLVGVWKNEQNFRFQVFFGLIVVVATLIFLSDPIEKSIIFLLICLVLVAELINTAFERMADILKPRIHPYIEQIKDILAAMVLIVSLFACIIGMVIFIPRILEMLG
ncbi:MAG: diacylglycerol kinase [Patescibacteria group bacterium]